jgi:hypothetical protein
LSDPALGRLVSTTVRRLDEEDIRALKRLARRGFLPSTLMFESTNSKLGDESELFRDIED